MEESWSREKSADLYGIKSWGSNYFGINERGHIEVHPEGPEGPRTDLLDLVEDLRERGIDMPILLRFPDLIRARIDLLNQCFQNAISEYNYNAKYTGVFPIKVNQQKHLVEEIVRFGEKYDFGLEAGSKPELLISLALIDTPKALLICNGFKDDEYIETALMSQKMGRNTIVVIDRMTELRLVLNASRKLKIRPRLGFRVKLSSSGSGKWAETSGAKSKFGLTPSEIVRGIQILREEECLESLELIHFHIGSQIPSIQSIKGAIKEAAHIYTEVYALGAKPKYIDVGGGLGVDYDGSGHSESSVNYSEQEYANDVVSGLQSICDERKVPHPQIISESGRSLIAHSSLLVFDVLGKNEVRIAKYDLEDPDKQSRLVQELWHIFQNVNTENLNEFYNDLVEKKRDTQQLFTYGVLSLEQRAKAEDLYWATTTKMVDIARNIGAEAEDIFYSLEHELSASYFCNFSVFQSLPDSWALGQTFPIMPIHRLNERPTGRSIIVDLTCDSDGHIERFADTESGGTQAYLEVHKLEAEKPYYLGAFLTGAYQEILGDLHNLFGDTDAVHVSIGKNGYEIDQVIKGDSVSEVLSYVEYRKSELLERVRKSCERGISKDLISPTEARRLIKKYEKSLMSSTYLQDPTLPKYLD